MMALYQIFMRIKAGVNFLSRNKKAREVTPGFVMIASCEGFH